MLARCSYAIADVACGMRCVPQVRRRRLNACVTIQAAFRGFVGRRLAKEQYFEVKRQQMEQLLSDPDYVLTLIFREKGAAIVLQQWYRFRRRWPRPAKIDRAYVRSRKAIDVQKVWRGYRARQDIVAPARKEREVFRAATRIQRQAKVWATRRAIRTAIAVRKAGLTADDLEDLNAGTVDKSRMGRFTSLVKSPFKTLGKKIAKARDAMAAQGVLKLLIKKTLTPDEASSRLGRWWREYGPDYVRERKAATMIQAHVRGFVKRRWAQRKLRIRKRGDYIRLYYHARKLQQVWRGNRVRRATRKLLARHRVARFCQKRTRGWLVRKTLYHRKCLKWFGVRRGW